MDRRREEHEEKYGAYHHLREMREHWGSPPNGWPSAAARDQHSDSAERGYLKTILPRRQLQGFVRPVV